MTDTAETRADDRLFFDANIRTPEMEMAEIGADVPSADGLTIDQINPHNPHLFLEDRWQDHFARLRAEDPVHLNELETSGRYWSVTKYEDVRSVDGDWETYSSAKGITLGLKEIAMSEETEPVGIQTFIAMDPPEHTAQRKTVRSVSAPSNLRNIEPMIRERTAELLDSLPEGESFDWVDTVSIELTTLMLATLFDFPMEDRRKLTRWSDIVFAIPGPGGVVETQQQKIDELLEQDEFQNNFEFNFIGRLPDGFKFKNVNLIEPLSGLDLAQELKNNHLYISAGERGKGMIAQDPSKHPGSIIRINLDGSIPKDNPKFINKKNWLPEIYQIGVRNPQGMSLSPYDLSLIHI